MCAGCGLHYVAQDTSFYRKKRWCNSSECKTVIDEKVTNGNYKKRQRKIEKGTFRNGVGQELRNFILDRDDHVCSLCNVRDASIGRMQVHHIVPVANGGLDDYDNLTTVCRLCHIKIHTNGWEYYVVSLKKVVEKMECLL
jgi:5-methylcytosine-specific restriction protein A